jgi:hypothetical protein
MFTNLSSETLKKKDHLENQGVVGKIFQFVIKFRAMCVNCMIWFRRPMPHFCGQINLLAPEFDI